MLNILIPYISLQHYEIRRYYNFIQCKSLTYSLYHSTAQDKYIVKANFPPTWITQLSKTF